VVLDVLRRHFPLMRTDPDDTSSVPGLGLLSSTLE